MRWDRSPSLRRRAYAVAGGCWLAFSIIAPPHSAAAPEPASATDIADQVGLAQISKSWSANVEDFDVDGDQDLMYVPHNETASKLYRNDGGSFSEVFAGTFIKQDRHDCAWGDVNADGRPDMYCSRGASSGTGTNPKELWIQQPAGGFANRASQYGVTDPYGRGRMATFIDVNHDDLPDLFTTTQYPRQDGVAVSNHLYLNDGGTAFLPAASYGLDVAVGGNCAQAADVDGDGWEDLLVCGQTSLHLYRNDGGTRFVEISGAWGVSTLTNGTHHARLADLTGDGKLDLLLVTQTSLRVMPQGAGRFDPASFQVPLTAGRWVAAGDFQGDGALDLYIVQGCRSDVDDPDILLLGDGTGADFAEVAQLPLATQGCGDVAETIDVDGDGNEEFVVLNGFGRTARGPLQVITSAPPTSPCTIIGTSGANTLTGTPGDDVICGFDGSDTIDGLGGHDVLIGGAGNDILIGDEGDDTLSGGDGVDTLEGGLGNDSMDGGSGKDRVRFNGLTQAVTVDIGAGTAIGQGSDLLAAIETVQGSSGNDVIDGDAGTNSLNGLGGNDRLTGGAGADTLIGGGGADTLLGVDGVGGNDTLDGKTGTDSCSADPGDSLISC
jgi:Ca2+-binding RTX toxin-like protein